MKTFLVLAALAATAAAQVQDISGERIRAHVKFLSSDLLEGRGVGVRGGQLATEYIATQFELAGAKPAGDDGTYFQRVPLVGIQTQPDSELSASAKGRELDFKFRTDFIGVNERQQPHADFDADAIFVGHGITAPEFGWDDFKGTDVKGKILVLFTNEPSSSDPKFFGGRALTYYGRWSYKYEEALRKGALGVIIIHTTPTAGYGWDVVRNSWGREEAYVRLKPGEPGLALAGWVTTDAGERLLKLSGHSVQELLKASDRRDFKPMPLGLRIHGVFNSKIRDLDTANVAAMVPGSDPELKSQAVIFSAHWDHLGIGMPVNGDSIYNGAMDNATGCAMLLELARAWASLPQKPRRSALFLAVTGEEAGLRGSEYYASHPIVPPGKTALGINLDGFEPLGRTKDISVSGAERTTAYPLIEDAAKRFSLEIKPDPRPEQGSYYRSDHFSFAKIGIPAFSLHLGSDFIGKPAGFGEKAFEEFNSKHYHQPSDEYHPDWDFSGLEQLTQFSMVIGMDGANIDRLPTWKSGDEFLGAREQSGVR